MMHKSWWAHPQFELDLKENCVGLGHMLVGLVHPFLLIFCKKLVALKSAGENQLIKLSYVPFRHSFTQIMF